MCTLTSLQITKALAWNLASKSPGEMLQVSQKGKRGHGDGGDEGGSHLDPDDLMGLTVSQHVSLRVSATLVHSHTPVAFLLH